MVLFFWLLLSLLQPLSLLSLNQEGRFLQQVKLSLTDPTRSLSSWNDRDDTPCKWRGITCDNDDSVSQRVTELDLASLQLGGPFPVFICRLSYLSVLSLSGNFINESLPADIATCQNLTSLDLSDNLLVGSLPEWLPRLEKLKLLNLQGNNFSGDIPESFGAFKSIEHLKLGGNLLNGKIYPSIGNLTTLKELAIGLNPFTSQLPSQLGKLSNLETLWASQANLVGTIPESIGQLSGLEYLDLSMNKLTGSIPSSLTELTSLVQLEIYQNSLSGELPANMSRMKSLRRFDASMNELNGTIPADLWKLPYESLNLYDNRLEGTISESIANSPNLNEFKLFNNKLSGEIPSQLGVNSPLKRLDLSYNNLEGKIPDNLCAKGELEDLLLISNSLSGNVPENLGRCQSLSRVRLKQNKLSGHVPDRFWGLQHVYLLELSENSLVGSISKMISSAKNLSVLLVSKNSFNGSIPDELGSLSNLLEFSANTNAFTGEIPGSLVNLQNLNRLDLSHNELSGSIPNGARGWENLNELNLANNRLSGEIPNEIGSLQVLNYLDLSSNHFTGKIPLELQNLKLNELNLSYNLLSGDLPPLYAKESYRKSFLGNPGLCSDLADLCPKTGRSKSRGYFYTLTSIFILAAVVFLVGIVWFYFKYRKFSKNKKGIAISKWKSFHKIGFSEYEITDCLKEENIIGYGASGKVYKVVLSSGEVVAVKKLGGTTKKIDASNDSQRDEFEVEVETLGKIRHKNIVRLWCCCSAGDCKLLVYEYMPNGSLGDLLRSTKAGVLDWPTRHKIALDAAEGLSYLHHDCVPAIVHRDVKSNNILIDGEFNARVADFGVAKVVKDVGKGAESMSVIAGSYGYIAPEYAYTLRVNEKSDIFSFGVVLLELVTGKLPTDPELGEKDLMKWVYTTLDQKGLSHVIDPNLDSSCKEEISMVLDIGLRCTSALPINRPSMRKVVNMLQEAGLDGRSKSGKRSGKLSPYYEEYVSERGSVVA
jgi:Leucine-rich repeat (LRR) protein